MNLIKSFLFLVSFLMISSVPFSQEVCYLNYEGNGQYAEEKDTFLSTGIASDFGPRKIGDFWHGGVDYNSSGGDAWDLILSPENVTIVDVNRLIRSGGGIRYLTLDAGDHRYLPVHMFDDNNSVP